MPIAAVLTFRGGTLERYDALLATLGFRSGGPGPPGALFSWVTKNDEGLLVTGVWESRRDFEQFAAEFGSFAAKVGVRGPPQVSLHDVHSYLTAARATPPPTTPAAARSPRPPPAHVPAPPP
ncbi:MAG: hypothetical protein QOD24_178 [Solirubrobacteraceae bacterium]|nr:hypothetical protein [Solirubrobacteraceae bacterium]